MRGLLIFGLTMLSLTGTVYAEEPHQAWMKYLKGSWEYEWPEFELKGECTIRFAAKRNALVARGEGNEGPWVELIGWRRDKDALVLSGYGSSRGDYWQIEHKKVTKDELSGTASGILPDGREVEGRSTRKRINDDKFEIHLEFKAGDETIKAVGTFTRKKE